MSLLYLVAAVPMFVVSARWFPFEMDRQPCSLPWRLVGALCHGVLWPLVLIGWFYLWRTADATHPWHR